mgnify:CR=1 FL=1
MPEAVLSPEQWDAVKAASIRGVPDSQLAESFGINGNAIRQRRFLDPLWKAAVQAKREELSTNPVGLTESLTKGPETASLAKKVASTISENAESLSSSNLLLASQIAQKGLHRAEREFDGLEIKDIGDVERIFKMAALAGKWNQPQVQVTQAFAFGGGQADENVLECETVIVEDGGNYGDAFNMSGNEGES